MKLIVLSGLFFFSQLSYSASLFQPHLDHEQAHELTWVFTKPVKDWGKTDKDQVTIKCANPLPDYDIKWSNATTLKLIPKKNLNPGEKCEGKLAIDSKDAFQFTVPKAKVLQVYPWSFNQLEEDAAFIVKLDAAVDPALVARDTYVEVEGMSEKVEVSIVEGEKRDAALKAAYVEEKEKSYVLQPRRTFPVSKDIAFVVKDGFAIEYKQEGRIRDPFSVIVRCDRTNESAPCSPLGKINLDFTNEVPRKYLEEIRLVAGKKEYKLELSDNVGSAMYVYFKTKLEPSTTYKVTMPSGIRDENDRELTNIKKFPVKMETAGYPPLAKFPGAFGILESEIEPVLPVTVRNIEKEVKLKKTSAVIPIRNPVLIMQWRHAVAKRQGQGWDENTELRHKSVFEGSPIPVKEEKIEYKLGNNEMEVLGLPLKGKGLHLVELSSPILAGSLLEKKPNFHVSTAVMVTNLAVHLKIGQTNSMAWVTTLDKGEVVSDATVKLHDCNGGTLAEGKTNKEGVVFFPKVTKNNLSCTSKVENFHSKIMAIASKGDDATFTLSDWSDGIEPWRFNISSWYHSEIRRAHTVFDRPIYKQGEKVNMLHLLRSQTENGLIFDKSFTHLRIYHNGSEKEWKLPLNWKDAGAAATSFSIPEEAAQGTYYVSLITLNKKNNIEHVLDAGYFLVKDFRVPLMRSDLQFKGKRTQYSAGEELTLLGHLEYLAGGAAGDTPVTLRTEVFPGYSASIPAYTEYSFRFGEPGESEPSSITLDKQTATTDKNGDVKFQITGIPKSSFFRTLTAEVEYMDPTGVFHTTALNADIFPFNEIVGLKTNSEEKKMNQPIEFGVLVLDLKEKPVKNREWKGVLYQSITTSARKKILGGFYTYDNSTRIEKVGEVCKGKTNAQGMANCKLKVEKGGYYILVAEAGESKNQFPFWVYGDSESWESQTHHDRMDLIADKKEYSPGEKAKLELKLPFEKGTVLVTKETTGVRTAWVTSFDRKNPFIEVPLENADFPNTFISAFVVRGRLADGQPTGLIDLSRPAYRMGITELKVVRKDHRLKLELIPEKTTYQVREKVKMKVRVTSLDGTKVANTKVAVSVFDEGLLLINAQNSFNPEASMYVPYGNLVTTATAQGQVIGKRHFGLKARPHGGGGGKDLKTRELFDTLIYWNPTLALNEKGEANVEFKLNDSLTSFKIYGVAYSETKFGRSDSRVVATQDVMTFAGTSPSIRTGDEFSAIYTLKNITDGEKNLSLRLTMNGEKIHEAQLKLAGGASEIVKVPVKAFVKTGEAVYVLTITEGTKVLDTIKTVQKILPLHVPQVAYSDLKQVNQSIEVAGNTTNERLAGTDLLLSSTLLPSLESMKAFMREYPYNCLEQQLARAVIMEDQKLWKKIDKELSTYVDTRGFLKFYPTGPADSGFIELTTYFLEITHWNKWKSSRDNELEATLARFVKGEIKNLHDWEWKNLELLRFRAMTALKLRNSSHFENLWLAEVKPPHEADTVMTLMDKWILLNGTPKANAAHEMIQKKLKIDGSTVTLVSNNNESNNWFFMGDGPVFGRFLLLQKTLPLQSGFTTFFKENEGKFIRGYRGVQRNGYFPDTPSNTLAYILAKKWDQPAVAGTTSVAGKKSVWKNNEAPKLSLTVDEAKQTQVVKHEGVGAPWVDVRYLAFPDASKESFEGIEVEQTIEGKEFKVQDRVKITVTIRTRSDVTLPGIRVPLPAGSTILGATSDLALSYEERTEQEWKGYPMYLPKGTHKIELTVRLNQPGDFEIPGTRVEALYSPEVFGRLPHWNMVIKE